MKAILYADGGSRGNPGDAGIGFALYGAPGEEILASGGWFIGRATNNEAEYQALIWGLENAICADVYHVDVFMDSELVVKQINGEYKIKKAELQALAFDARALIMKFDEFSISHVKRDKNEHADLLANEAMDAKEGVGSYLIAYKEGEIDLNSEMNSEKNNEKTTGVFKQSGGLYELSLKGHFDAAHALVGYPGECANLHGHTWDVEVVIVGRELDEVGIVYDFKRLRADLNEILSEYDHKYLNELPSLAGINSTAENLARIVFEKMAARLPSNIEVKEISVWESPTAKLTYRLG